jgi:ADP-ribose pyrophosphatase YjhB (NUDIX family)
MSKTECTFTSGTDWFRLRACGILMDDGKVLMVRNDEDPYYYSVGGCVEHGESLEEAVVREVWEETGWKFQVDRLAFIHENFFRGKGGNIEGLRCHELAFYYLMRWDPSCIITSNSSTTRGLLEYLEWLRISQLNDLGIAVYPTFFADELLNLPLHTKHIVTYESDF